jgi:uncharacterized NAD(P)/FAD-binding protein YdhS
LTNARNVLILGGGASGTLLAIQILRAATDTNVTLIERMDVAGKGIAYGSADPIHLLNVRAANMSAYPDIPDHFMQWLDEDEDVKRVTDRDDNFRFASRLAFGNYLTSQLRQLGAATGRLTRVHGEAVALSRSPSGIVVTLDNFRRVKGDIAVIATGYESPGLSGMPANLIPWLHVDRMHRNAESILLLGTGLSTVDHVQSLIAAGYQGTIYAISRRGLLPKSHRPIEATEIGESEIPFGKGLTKIFRWLRTRAEEAEEGGSDWRAVVDGLRPYVQQLWQSLSLEDQSRFVRHARPWWDVRRHRMAPKVAAAIDDLLATGRLVIIAAKIVSFVPQENGNGIEVRYRRRGKHQIETLDVRAVTDCTGFSIDISKATNPLVRNLLDQGVGRPDRLGLGFDVDKNAGLFDGAGAAAQDIFALGPLTRGAFWEITGIPDIRAQCAQLAEKLTQSTGAAQTPSNARTASR